MNAHIVAQIENLLRTGMQLAPEGGSEFSGYNAKKQSTYLLWRKNCLDAVGALNDDGAAFTARITGDENGMYFYHSSAQHIITVLNDARDAARTAMAEADARARAEAKAREEEARERARIEEETRIEAERKAREEAELKARAEEEAIEQARREEAAAEAAREEARRQEAAAEAEREEARRQEAITEAEREEARRQEAAAEAAREEEAREEARQQIAALEARRAQEEREAPQQESVLAEVRKEADDAAEARASQNESDHAQEVSDEQAAAEHGTRDRRTAAASPAAPKILICTLENHVMLRKLRNIFNEIDAEHAIITHADGIWSGLDSLDEASRYYAVFLLSDRYHGQELMALGYLAGRYPLVQICCIHAHTLSIGGLLPGVSKMEFAVSLDEIAPGLISTLKAAGCSVSE